MFIVVKMGSTNVVVTVVGTAADKVLKVLELTHSAWFNVFVVHVSPGLQKIRLPHRKGSLCMFLEWRVVTVVAQQTRRRKGMIKGRRFSCRWR